MHIRGRHPPLTINRLRPAPAIGAQATGNRHEPGGGQRMMIGMPTQGTFRQFDSLQRQCRQTLLHHRIPGQQADQFCTRTFDIGERIEQIQHAATFGEQGFARLVVRANRAQHRGVLRQRHMMQFRVTARQIEAVCLG